MKINVTPFHLSFWLLTLWPLSSAADIRMPFWMDPQWIQTKLMDFHARNTDRVAEDITQAAPNVQAQNQNNANFTTKSNEPNARRSSPASVETAVPKMNEKYLSKDELAELRKQLRQKQ